MAFKIDNNDFSLGSFIGPASNLDIFTNNGSARVETLEYVVPNILSSGTYIMAINEDLFGYGPNSVFLSVGLNGAVSVLQFSGVGEYVVSPVDPYQVSIVQNHGPELVNWKYVFTRLG